MQRDQSSEPQGPLADLRWQFNALTHAAAAVGFPIAVWTTRLGTWGERYLGGWAAVGCLWPLVFAGFYGPHERVGDVLDFWLLTLLLLLLHRAAGASLRAKGYRCHSRSWGTSWLQRGDGLDAQKKARLLDGVAALLAGFAASAAGSEPLGALLVVGAAAKLFTDALAFQATDARVRQMEDGRQETEYYGELFRERQR